MQSYFEGVIKQLTDKHTELMNSAESVRLTDETMFDVYHSQASGTWDRKCDAETYLKEWERQNASDLALVNGPIKVVEFHTMRTLSTVVLEDNDGSTIQISRPNTDKKNVLENLQLLKTAAHQYLSENTEYIIPVPSQNIFNDKESVRGC